MTWLAVGLSAAFAVALFWVALHRKARFPRLIAPQRALEERAEGNVRGVAFPALDGTRIDGWLFLPKSKNAPIVILAPGLGGTKDGFLEPFAWQFVARGIAALVFDYRCFGGSDGVPRHFVDPKRHGEDYEAAIAFARGELARQGLVDPERVALWGSSFSGGTALVLAANARHSIRALVVQCPFLKTPPNLEPRGWALLRYVFWTTLDLSCFFPPIYVPMFGRPSEWAFATSRECPSVADFDGPLGAEFWRALPKPALGGWENRMLARALATIDAFVPMKSVLEVDCPVLFVAARQDDLVPVAFVEEAHRSTPSANKRLVVLDATHFDLYWGPNQPGNAAVQADFLALHLGSARPQEEGEPPRATTA